MEWQKQVAAARRQLTATVKSRYNINRHFGVEVYAQQWVGAMSPKCPREPSHGGQRVSAGHNNNGSFG